MSQISMRGLLSVINLLLIGFCILAWAMVSAAHADKVAPIPTPSLEQPPAKPVNPLPIGEPLPDADCTQIVQELRKQNTLTSNNNLAVADFVTQVANVMMDWYNELRPLEGETVPVPPGKFANIDKGARETEEVVALVYENSSFLEERMNHLIGIVEACLAQNNQPR